MLSDKHVLSDKHASTRPTMQESARIALWRSGVRDPSTPPEHKVITLKNPSRKARVFRVWTPVLRLFSGRDGPASQKRQEPAMRRPVQPEPKDGPRIDHRMVIEGQMPPVFETHSPSLPQNRRLTHRRHCGRGVSENLTH